tara:strand:- start:549 stop:1106 length:558 start_codon:yes stop_codon:yes gene_type:complete
MARSKYIQSVLDAAGGRPKSTQWFRDKIKEFGEPSSSDLIRDGKRTISPTFGLLNMFIYDPKLKDKLPYYDTFPLVLPVEEYGNGFLGINLHYLSMPMRMRLLDRLVDFSNNNKFDDSTSLNVNYRKLKNINLIKPCLKRYLASNVKTQFRKVEADEFVVATLLPVQRFKKQSDNFVFSKSRGMV